MKLLGIPLAALSYAWQTWELFFVPFSQKYSFMVSVLLDFFNKFVLIKLIKHWITNVEYTFFFPNDTEVKNWLPRMTFWQLLSEFSLLLPILVPNVNLYTFFFYFSFLHGDFLAFLNILLQSMVEDTKLAAYFEMNKIIVFPCSSTSQSIFPYQAFVNKKSFVGIATLNFV